MKKLNKSTFAIMTVFFIAAGGSAVNSAINVIITAFPNVEVSLVRLISTLPTLTAMLITLTAGAVVGRKLKYKTLMTFGIVCFIIGGVGPAIFNTNIYVVLAFRAVFGIATGCFASRNAYLLTTVEKDRQAKMIGNGQVVQNAGAAVLQLVCGYLADIKWNLAFYPYFVAVVALFCVVTMMKEPEMHEQSSGAAQSVPVPEGKGRLGNRFIIYMIIQFLTMLHAMPVLTGMSTLIAQRGLGGSSVTGVILAVCQVGGLVTGVIFGRFLKILGRYTLAGSLFVQGLGVFLMLIFDNVVMIGAGVFLSGVGTILIVSTNLTWTGQSMDKKRIALGTALVTAVGNIGSFISPYWIQITHSYIFKSYAIDVESVYLMGSIVFAALIVACIVVDVGAKPLPSLEVTNEA